MLDYSKLPNPGSVQGMQLYFEHGIMPGSFLSALLCNDLLLACGKADDMNRHLLFEHVAWLFNEAPAAAYGSPAACKRWCETKQREQEAKREANT